MARLGPFESASRGDDRIRRSTARRLRKPRREDVLALSADEPLAQFVAGEEVSTVRFPEILLGGCRDRENLDVRLLAVLDLGGEPRVKRLLVGLELGPS